jgi:hypothetical protein
LGFFKASRWPDPAASTWIVVVSNRMHCTVLGLHHQHDLRAAEDHGLGFTRHRPSDHLAIGLPGRRLGLPLDEFLVHHPMHLGPVGVVRHQDFGPRAAP